MLTGICVSQTKHNPRQYIQMPKKENIFVRTYMFIYLYFLLFFSLFFIFIIFLKENTRANHR